MFVKECYANWREIGPSTHLHIYSIVTVIDTVYFSALTLLVGWQEGHLARESLYHFTRTMPARAGISCHHVSVCLSVCQSVRVSQVGVLLKRLNVGLHKRHHTIVFWCQKARQNSHGVTLSGGTKCRWDRLNAGAVAVNRRLSTWSFAA